MTLLLEEETESGIWVEVDDQFRRDARTMPRRLDRVVVGCVSAVTAQRNGLP
jgi:hypothetical protein